MPRHDDAWTRLLFPPALVLASAGFSHAERYLSVDEAQASIFPGQKLIPSPVTLTPDQAQAIERASGVPVRVRELKLWRAERGGLFIVDEVLGKHELITWALGIEPDGSVKQIEVLDYRETYGNEVRGEKWRAQFRGKKQGDRMRLDDDIKNISGATLSCRHVTEGVKRLLATYDIALKR
jgi:hypothetical protein